jgi:hypothetical protein
MSSHKDTSRSSRFQGPYRKAVLTPSSLRRFRLHHLRLLCRRLHLPLRLPRMALVEGRHRRLPTDLKGPSRGILDVCSACPMVPLVAPWQTQRGQCRGGRNPSSSRSGFRRRTIAMGSEIIKMGRIIDFSRQEWNHYFCRAEADLPAHLALCSRPSCALILPSIGSCLLRIRNS